MFQTNKSKLKARHRTSRRKLRCNKRRGSAVVEAALCIPFVIILMLGTLEVCSGIYLKESLTVSAYEGVRAGIGRRSERDQVVDTVNQMLEDRNIADATVLIEPANFDSLNALDPVSVTIEAPTAGNSLYIFDSMVNRTVRARVIMVREFDD
jgi:Flp pilus assembly protein TadG